MKRPVRAIGYGAVAVTALAGSEINPAEVPLVLGLGLPAVWLVDFFGHRYLVRVHRAMVADAARTIAGARNPERVARQISATIRWRGTGGKGPLPQWIKEMP